MNVPPLSVLMPVRDTQAYLSEALRSVLDQNVSDFELVLVDDGSTDGSYELAQEFARRDARVRVYQSPGLGIAGALNQGLALCRAPLVARMDSDDISLPRRFERQMAYLENDSDCVLVSGQGDLIDEDGDLFGWVSMPLEHDAILRMLRRGECSVIHGGAIYRTEAVRFVGGYRPDYLAEEVDLFLRLGERGRLANLPHLVLHYRKREDSVTATWDAARVMAERRARAAEYHQKGVSPTASVEPWREPVGGDATAIARMGLALHAGFDATAWKYARRLLAGRATSPSLWAALSSRFVRSFAHRLLRPPTHPLR
jgi:glycosyltransferase involved in cell wall biosynthesis